MQRLLIIQASLVLIAIIATIYYLGAGSVLAALFGGCIAIANSIMLYRKLDAAGSMAEDNPDAGVMTLYAGVIQRFIFVLAMFAIGIKLLELHPVAMLGAFGLAQLAYMISGVRQQS